jgi:transcriptional regulator with XRE-family HTH domain
MTILNRSAAPKRRRREFYPPDSLIAQVGRRIRALRNAQGTSLRAFGKTSGVHPFHVNAIELGQLAANTKTLRSIATALGVKPADILNHGADGDDAGQIVELLRLHPEQIPTMKTATANLVAATSKGSRR